MSCAGDSRDVPSLANFEIKEARRCTSWRICIIITVIVCLVLIGAVIGLALGFGWRRSLPLPNVSTPCGFVSGEIVSGIYIFLGLPYAQPPVGALRFRHPRDIYSHDTCHDAFPKKSKSVKAFRPACLQRRPFKQDIVGSEDCLYLNVFSPDIRSSQARPVVVVLGGLFFLYGSGHVPGFRVTPELIKATDAVHVTLNSRLGAHGFLPADGPAGDANVGLWDIVSALRWVKANIHRFGGDPDNVMLFGYGSGATSALVLSMAASTVTFNLFHKVWLASPMLRVERNVQQATAEYTSRLGCISRACLTNKTDAALASLLSMSEDLRRIWFELPQNQQTQRQPGILLVDNVLIRESPADATNLRLNNIPFVIGSTTNEVDVYLSPDGVRLWDALSYEQYVNSSLKPSPVDFRAIKSLYPLASGTIEEVFTRLVTDSRVTCPLLCFSKNLRKKARLVYQYVVRGIERYVDPYEFQFRINNSFHGWDALLYFSDGSLNRLASGDPKGEYRIRDRLRRAVRQFSRSGNVEQFRSEAVNVIDVPSIKHVKEYKAAECRLWRRLAKNNCFSHAWAT